MILYGMILLGVRKNLKKENWDRDVYVKIEFEK